ncbi:MAG: hypothetical protein RSK76_01460 [Clostridia bacterium]
MCQLYRYYTLYRPPMPGAVPKEGLKRAYGYDTRQLVIPINKWAWGYVEYDRPLSDKEISVYELSPERTIITMDNWPERWESVAPGTEISEDVYNEMLNVLPPIYIRAGHSTYFSGFQMGEPQDHREGANGKWRARYLTFISARGRYYYAGIHFLGECNFELFKEMKQQ